MKIRALHAGVDNLILLDKDMQEKVFKQSVTQEVDLKDGNIGVGKKEFEAWMRMLDSQVNPLKIGLVFIIKSSEFTPYTCHFSSILIFYFKIPFMPGLCH